MKSFLRAFTLVSFCLSGAVANNQQQQPLTSRGLRGGSQEATCPAEAPLGEGCSRFDAELGECGYNYYWSSECALDENDVLTYTGNMVCKPTETCTCVRRDGNSGPWQWGCRVRRRNLGMPAQCAGTDPSQEDGAPTGGCTAGETWSPPPPTAAPAP